jgi:hypothetical protein
MSILGAFPLTTQGGNSPLSPYRVGAQDYTPGRSFFEYNGKTIYYDLNCEEDYRRAYLLCAPLKAVINRRAQMFVNGNTTVLNRNNDNPLRGEYAKQLQRLLKKPNILQTGKQFKAQQEIYIDLFGYCPVLKVTPVGFPKEVKALWNLPPWLFEVEFQRVQFYNQTELKSIYKQFYINWEGKRNPLDMDNVFLVLDNSIGTDSDGNLLMPDSRVRSMEYSISNEIAAKQAANTLITKKGAIGILSNDPGTGAYAPLKVGAEKENIQRDFRRYGITGNEWQVIITDASLKWQAMSFPMKDLMLFETMTAAQADICDGMGMYAYLMNNKAGDGTTFTNLGEAKKSQYQDFIIPDDDARAEQMSASIIPEDEGAYLKVDYSHVEALQESQQAKAVTTAAQADAYQAQFDLGIMTRNQILEDMGKPKVNDPDFDKYNFQFPQPSTAPARFPSQAAAE